MSVLCEYLVLNRHTGTETHSLIVKANLGASEDERLPKDEILAQMSYVFLDSIRSDAQSTCIISSFIFAGTDTTSSALTQALQLLAEHPRIQDKVRAEVLLAAHGSDVPYDELHALPYLDSVCRETLRLYVINLYIRERPSFIGFLMADTHLLPLSSESGYTFCNVRKVAGLLTSYFRAVQSTMLPFSEPVQGKNGEMLSRTAVPKGTAILLNLRGSNINKAVWGEDALQWKPERWLSPPPKSLTDARIPAVYSNL